MLLCYFIVAASEEPLIHPSRVNTVTGAHHHKHAACILVVVVHRVDAGVVSRRLTTLKEGVFKNYALSHGALALKPPSDAHKTHTHTKRTVYKIYMRMMH